MSSFLISRQATGHITRRRSCEPGGRLHRHAGTERQAASAEFYAFVATVAAVLIAAAQADNSDAPRAWTIVGALAIGYMVSRELAKSGSAHRDRHDDRRM